MVTGKNGHVFGLDAGIGMGEGGLGKAAGKLFRRRRTCIFSMEQRYIAGDQETKWYEFWLKEGLFRPREAPGTDAGDTGRRTYSVVIPPPNVTGILHMGHALNATLQDVLVRWKRMRGYAVLWLPGMDHAGIHTQMKVEEELRAEGLDRHQVGREEFIRRVWVWKEKYGRVILDQLRHLGVSCDWERERFTLDEGLSRAVREVFVRLYREGLIYRGKRIINWCPCCRTALSDIEVDHREEKGALHHLRYPLADGGGCVVVATTRPETMLGDTAVAVHPEDPRYAALVGREVALPLTGRRIPVLADAAVEREFGTGAVKVTPAHDPTDFEIGERHGLPRLVVIGEDARMTQAAPSAYAGLDRYACRRAVLADLDAAGLLEKVEEHVHAVGHCTKCGTVIEPLLSDQWFVKMDPLAADAAAAVREGRPRFVPERFAKLCLQWMDNVRDWCISRQIWWGHRIPAWYCDVCGTTVVEAEAPERCPVCGSDQLRPDPDVLDTWFSSALWPFSTLGWPDETRDLARFYPTSLLVTAYDIIFFWIARMIFQGLHLTGEVPFADVLIHGIVRDDQGRKMSKSLGNGIDPLEVIDRYGADALRFTLLTGNSPGNDLRFSWERAENAHHFANKLWNAARFVTMNLDGVDAAAGEIGASSPAARWIRTRFAVAVAEVDGHLEGYELGEAARVVREFIWGDYCDWFVELAKVDLRAGGDTAAATRRTLAEILEGTLRLAHPFMPFVTEAIWQQLPPPVRGAASSISVAAWPEPAAPGEEEILTFLQEVIRTVRNLRAEVQVPANRRARVVCRLDPERWRVLREFRDYVFSLAAVESVELLGEADADPPKAMSGRVPGGQVFLPLENLLDLEAELARLAKEENELGRELGKVAAKLENAGFMAKAPAEVVAGVRAKEAELQARLEAVRVRAEALR